MACALCGEYHGNPEYDDPSRQYYCGPCEGHRRDEIPSCHDCGATLFGRGLCGDCFTKRVEEGGALPPRRIQPTGPFVGTPYELSRRWRYDHPPTRGSGSA